jgi:hypothetical protein
VLPVATSGKERGGKGGGGYTRSTTISIRSRPAEEQAAAQNGSKGGGNPAPVVMELVADPAAPAAAAYPNTLPAAAALFGTAEAVRYSHLLEQLQVGAWDGLALGWAGQVPEQSLGQSPFWFSSMCSCAAAPALATP